MNECMLFVFTFHLKNIIIVGFDANENWDGFIRLSLEEYFLMR